MYLPYFGQDLESKKKWLGSWHMSARKTLELCRSPFPKFWVNDDWTGNSPDLSRIENLWVTVHGKCGKSGVRMFEGSLDEGVLAAWSIISSKMLKTLVSW